MAGGIMFKTNPKFINVRGPGGTGEMNDLELQSREAQRQQQMAMAQALKAQALNYGGTEMVSGLAVPKSPWEILGKLGAGFIGSQDEKFLQGQQQSDLKARQEGLSKALSEYVGLRDGAPGGEPLAGPTPDGTPLTTQAIPGDPRKAAMGAFTSGYKELQGLGQLDLQAQAKAAADALKGRMDPGEMAKMLMPHATPKSRADMALAVSKGLDPSQFFVGSRDLKQFDPSRQILDPDALPATGAGGVTAAGGMAGIAEGGGQPGVVPYQPPRMQDERAPDGGLMQRDPLTGKLNMVDQGTKITVGGAQIINKGNEKMLTSFSDATAKRLDKEATVAESAAALRAELPSLRARMEAAAPIITGAGADLRTKGLAVFRLLGVPVDEAAIVNSQTFDQVVNNVMAANMAALGARGLTDKDMQILKDAMVNRNMEPEAIKAAIDQIEARTTSTIETYNQKINAFRNALPEGPEGDLLRSTYIPLQLPGPNDRKPIPVVPPMTNSPAPAAGPKTLDWNQIMGGKR